MKKFLIITIIILLTLLKPIFSNTTISYDGKFLSYLSEYNKYFLWDLENKKLVKISDLNSNYIFYITNDTLAILLDNSISIANNLTLKPESEYKINYKPFFLYSINATENYYKFLLLTDRTINLCQIKNNKLTYLKKDTILKPSNLVPVSNNSFLISANRFVYLYTISNFLWFNFINKKKMLDFDKIVNYIDIDNKKNKFLVLISDGKLKLYTINFQNLKEIQLNKGDIIALYALNNSDIVVSDKSSNIRVYSLAGNIKDSINLPNKVIDIKKTTKELIIIYGDPNNPKLKLIDQNYNTIADI